LLLIYRICVIFCESLGLVGSDAVSKQMSDKLQFVAQSDKLKHVGHQTAPLPSALMVLTHYDLKVW